MLWGQPRWVHILALPLVRCKVSGKSRRCSEFWFRHLPCEIKRLVQCLVDNTHSVDSGVALLFSGPVGPGQ